MDGEQTKDGLKALKDLKGYRKDEQRFQIRIGRNEMVNDRVSDDKSFSTPTFAIDEIIEVYASAPKSKEIKVDEVISVITELTIILLLQQEKAIVSLFILS